ncbi:MAG: hypothetical protein V3V99_09375 [candidate division Zixibacteria bacterium]
MKTGLIFLAAVMLLPTFCLSDSGTDFIIKGGFVDDFQHPGLRLPDQNFDRQDLAGGQFYFSQPEIFDLIVGVDLFQQKRDYLLEGHEINLRMRDMAVTASLVIPIEFSSLDLFIGAGCGSHSLAFEYVRPRDLSLTANGVIIPEVSTYFGYHAIAGMKYDLPGLPVGIYAESKFNRVNLPAEDIEYKSFAMGIFLSLP